MRWAWISARRRPDAPPRRLGAAVRLAISWRRRATRARRSSVGASGRGRGVGRTASAKWAPARASRASVVGQRPGGVGNVPYLTGVDPHDRPGGRGQRRDHGPLVAPSGFEHHQRGLHRLEPHHEAGHPGGIGGHRPAFTARAHRHIELGLWRHPYQHRRVGQTSLS